MFGGVRATWFQRVSRGGSFCCRRLLSGGYGAKRCGKRSGNGSHGHGHGNNRTLRFDRCFWALAGGIFTFQKHGIPDERLQKGHDVRFERNDAEDLQGGWELLYEDVDVNLRVFRRRMKEIKHEVYEYRVAGTFRDITPRHYIDAQNDVDFRSEWDQNVLKLEVIQDDGDQQLIRWVTKYPYPMYPREYVFVRRSYVSSDNRVVVIESEAVPEDAIPTSSRNNVRVATYTSQCAVRAHSNMDSQGLDYVLTYFDNPEANIPTYAYNWIVNQGGPYFVKQVHEAAKKLEQSGREVKSFFGNKASATPVEICACNHSCPLHCPKEEASEAQATEANEGSSISTEGMSDADTYASPESSETLSEASSSSRATSPLTAIVAKIVDAVTDKESIRGDVAGSEDETSKTTETTVASSEATSRKAPESKSETEETPAVKAPPTKAPSASAQPAVMTKESSGGKEVQKTSEVAVSTPPVTSVTVTSDTASTSSTAPPLSIVLPGEDRKKLREIVRENNAKKRSAMDRYDLDVYATID